MPSKKKLKNEAIKEGCSCINSRPNNPDAPFINVPVCCDAFMSILGWIWKTKRLKSR